MLCSPYCASPGLEEAAFENQEAQTAAFKKLLIEKPVEKEIAIKDDTPEQESPSKTENDLEAEDEYYKKIGVVRPPAPPASFVPKSSQSTVQQLSARLRTTQAAGSASAQPLKANISGNWTLDVPKNMWGTKTDQGIVHIMNIYIIYIVKLNIDCYIYKNM